MSGGIEFRDVLGALPDGTSAAVVGRDGNGNPVRDSGLAGEPARAKAREDALDQRITEGNSTLSQAIIDGDRTVTESYQAADRILQDQITNNAEAAAEADASLSQQIANSAEGFNAAILNAGIDAGTFINDTIANIALASGSTVRKDANGNNIGFNVPAGSTGKDTFYQSLLSLTDQERILLAGSTIDIIFDCVISENNNLTFVEAFDAASNYGGGLPVSKLKITKSGTRLVAAFRGKVPANGVGGLSPLLVVNSTTTAPGVITLEVRDIFYKVVLTDDLVRSAGQINSEWLSLRAKYRSDNLSNAIADNATDAGVFLSDSTPNVQVSNGASIRTDSNGKQIGFAIPIPQTGIGTFYQSVLALSPEETALIAGCTLAIEYDINLSANSILTFTSAYDAANGTGSFPVAQRRVTKIGDSRVIVGFQGVIPSSGVTQFSSFLQVASNSTTTGTINLDVRNITYRVISSADKSRSAGQINSEWLSLRLNQKAVTNSKAISDIRNDFVTDAGVLFPDSTPYVVTSNGAVVRMNSDNKAVGFNVPAGFSGKDTYYQSILNLTPDEQILLRGAEIEIVFDIETSNNDNLNFVTVFDAASGSGGLLVTQSRATKINATRRILGYKGTISAAGVTALTPFIQVASSTTIGSQITIEVKNIYYRVTATTDVARSTGQINSEWLALRLYQKCVTNATNIAEGISDAGAFLPDSTASIVPANGATIINDFFGKPDGFSVPAGSTGKDTFYQSYLPLTFDESAILVGAQIEIIYDLRVSSNFNLTFVPAFDAAANLGGMMVAQTRNERISPTRHIFAVSGQFPGSGLLAFNSFLQVASTTTAADKIDVHVSNIYYRAVKSNDKGRSAGQINAQWSSLRALQKIATVMKTANTALASGNNADRVLNGVTMRDRVIARTPNLIGSTKYNPASDGNAIYVFATRIRASKALTSMTLFPADFNAAVVLQLQGYTRLDETSTLAPGLAPGDVAIVNIAKLLTPNAAGVNLAGGEEIVGTPTNQFAWNSVKIDFPDYGPVAENTLIVWKVEAIGSDGVTRVPIGWATGIDLGAVPQIYRGYTATAAAPTTMIPTPSGRSIPYTLSEAFHYSAISGAFSPGFFAGATALSTAVVQSAAPGLTVTIPEIVVESAGQPFVIASQSLTFQRPAQKTVTDRVPLQYLYFWQLSQLYISNVSVKSVSDGSTLQAGVDYQINYASASISGIKNQPNIMVDVTYVADLVRYDLVYSNPYVGGAAIVVGPSNNGEGRGGDVNAYMADIPVNSIPLFRAFVTNSRGVELIPLYNWRGYAKRGEEGNHAMWLEYCRKALKNFWPKCKPGKTVRVAVYSDSICAQGTGYPYGDGSVGGFYRWGGDSRDNHDYTNTGRYTQAQQDQLAPLVNGHTEIGYPHFFRKALEKATGCTVQYENWGIGGTNSGPGKRNGVPDGADPDRLGAIVASKPDLVILAFGMGEIGYPDTYANHQTIIRNLKAVGADFIVCSVPLPNQLGFTTAPLENWRFTCSEICRVAYDEGVAFIPFQRWVDPRNLGAFGFSYKTACQMNGSNHPDVPELAKYGEMLAQIIPPFNKGLAPGEITALYGVQSTGTSVKVLEALASDGTKNRFNFAVLPPGQGGTLTLRSDTANASEPFNIQGLGNDGGNLRSGQGNNLISWNVFGISFNGSPVIAKPTVSGSKGGNAALGSLVTALANYGLITDSTSN